MASPYDRIAPFYDALRQLYGWGQIEACLDHSVRAIPAGARVLLIGCGTAQEAVGLASRGASVTLVDRSGVMLGRAARRLRGRGTFDLLQMDVRELRGARGYDFIVANFFLNGFDDEELPEMLEHLGGLLRPKGRMVISDFAPLEGSTASRACQWFHHALPMALFRLLAGSPLHRVRNYARRLCERGFEVQERVRFRAFGIGPRWYEVLVAGKNGS